MSFYGVKKRLKDFPVGEWIRAAGLCGYFDDEDSLECEGRTEVKIGKSEEADIAWMMIRCDNGHTDEDVVGWKVGEKPVSLGKVGNFYPLLSRANNAYCASCGLIITGVPLILWGPNAPENVQWEVNFCWQCAGKLDLSRMLKF